MKQLYKIFLAIFVLAALNSGYSQVDSVTNTITNFNIISGTQFSFDIYSLRTTSPTFLMGNSSFFVKFSAGAMSNPRLSNINPKYTIGSFTNSYDSMEVGFYPFATYNRVGVQLNYIGGPGDNITSDPGSLGLGERMATVTLDINSSDLRTDTTTLLWDVLNSEVVSTGFLTAASTWNGSFIGVLPVELASFTSNINKNNVNLNWSTSSEINNSGFEIERKSVSDENVWSKIAFVQGNGNSQEMKNYNYSDLGLTAGRYNYRLKQIDFNGNYEFFELESEVVVGVPNQFELSQNYPNPFNPSTSITFSLPADSKVSLNIYDISGRLVSTLINNEFKTANYYTVTFNGSNLSSGTYFYKIQTERNSETKKMLLIK